MPAWRTSSPQGEGAFVHVLCHVHAAESAGEDTHAEHASPGWKGFVRHICFNRPGPARTRLSPGAHTLRHSFASIGNDLRYTESTIGAVIGHETHSITADYIHHLDPVLLAAADNIASEVRRQMLEGTRSSMLPTISS